MGGLGGLEGFQATEVRFIDGPRLEFGLSPAVVLGKRENDAWVEPVARPGSSVARPGSRALCVVEGSRDPATVVAI